MYCWIIKMASIPVKKLCLPDQLLGVFLLLRKCYCPFYHYNRHTIQNGPNNMKKLFSWQRLSTQYKCPVVACCGIGTQSWGGRAGGHSVSWQKLAAQALWRHVSHHHWESADRQTAGMWRWRRRDREQEKEKETGHKCCVTSGACRFTV